LLFCWLEFPESRQLRMPCTKVPLPSTSTLLHHLAMFAADNILVVSTTVRTFLLCTSCRTPSGRRVHCFGPRSGDKCMGGQPYLVKIRSSVSKLVLFVSIEIDTHAMRMLTSWQPADKRASARALLVDWCALDCTPSTTKVAWYHTTRLL
jgi:hypothetical protein